MTNHNADNAAKPTINIDDLFKWMQGNKGVMYAAISKHNTTIQLYVNLNGGYTIYQNDTRIFDCIQPFAAVEKYNELCDELLNQLNNE